jgi:hypothetical protein
VLFSIFALPHFTWLFGLYSLFTNNQRMELDHLYFTLLKCVYHCQYCDDLVFSYIYNEKPLDDLCYAYWEKYTKALLKSKDGFPLLEQSALNVQRSDWVEEVGRICCLHRSKRFVQHVCVLEQALIWMVGHRTSDSIVVY